MEKKKCPKPKCEVLCAAEGEGLWFGMRDGSVGAIFEGQEHQEPTDKKMIWAFSDDCHSGAVRSMVYQEGGNGGKIWSGCDEGTLIAWEARKVGVEDGIELPSSVYGGMFMVEEAGKDEDEGVWITVEEVSFLFFSFFFLRFFLNFFSIGFAQMGQNLGQDPRLSAP